MWWVQPMEIADTEGKPTGRWRLTARSDEGGGGPFGDTTHDHASAQEAQACDRCDEFTAGITGFPSRRRKVEMREELDRREFEWLKDKYEPSSDDSTDRQTGDVHESK